MSYNITISSDHVVPFELTNMIYDKLEEIHKTYQNVTFTIKIATELGASVSTPSNPELPTRAYVDWITSKMAL